VAPASVGMAYGFPVVAYFEVQDFILGIGRRGSRPRNETNEGS